MSEESVGDAGASHLGYYCGRFSPGDGGRSIAANGYTGALHMWRRSGGNINGGGGGSRGSGSSGSSAGGGGPGEPGGGQEDTDGAADSGQRGGHGGWSGGGGSEEGHWVPQHAAGGHSGPVVDACWGWKDDVLLTAGHDQTVRVFSSLPAGGWCEVARPQVHLADSSPDLSQAGQC